MKLVVTHAFGDKKLGDEITDADEIAQVLGERPGNVVRVATAEAPEPGPESADPSKA